MIVVDASVVLASCLPSEIAHPSAQSAFRFWLARHELLCAPPLLHAEVTAVLRKLVYTQRLERESADQLLQLALQLPIQIIDDTAIYPRSLTLAHQFGQPRAYDTQYLAVAELFNGVLWTADERFVRTVTPTCTNVFDINTFVVA
jgi:predicted nucleic acid-binding protein